MAEDRYRNKIILAPMVRICTLPTRLLCLKYGADLLYSEELIDYKLIQCKRIINRILDTVDFICTRGKCVFRTCKEEKSKIILQIGTSDAERALKAAKLVEHDVAGIDVNMGCPKDFSLKGGMGAALLKQPEKVKDILTTLVKGISIPVSCKIRILPTKEETIELVKLIQSTGVSAIAVHGRTQTERSLNPVNIELLKEIAQISTVPVIANGGSNDITCYEDIEEFKKLTNCSSVMVARAAQWDPSVFRKEGIATIDNVSIEYLKRAVDYDNPGGNTKYCLAHIMHRNMDSPNGKKLIKCYSVKDMCNIWNLLPYYENAMGKRTSQMELLSMNELKELNLLECLTLPSKKTKLEPEITEDGIYELYVVYDRRAFANTKSPKTVLHDWTRLKKDPLPVYHTIERKTDRMFKSTVLIQDEKFSSSHWAKNRRFSEQEAAIVATELLEIICQ